MRSNIHDQDDSEEIPLAPLIDVVFLLLIFFLVSTMIKKIDRDIDIQLPDSRSAEKFLPRDDNRVIGIDAGGRIFYEGEASTIQSLHTRIRQLSVAGEQPQIRLDVDRETPTHRVIEVLDLCRFNNLREVGIRTYDEFYNR